MKANVIELKEVTLADLALVGGKTASLGEMISHLAALGIPVPGGFAIPHTRSVSLSMAMILALRSSCRWIAFTVMRLA